MKKKIVFYYPDFYVGGVEMAILNLAKRLYNEYDIYFWYNKFSDKQLELTFRQYGTTVNVAGEYPEFECDTFIYCSLWQEKTDKAMNVKARQRVLWAHAIIPVGGNKFYHLPTMRKMDKVVVVSEATFESIPFHLYKTGFVDQVSVINNILNVEDIIEKSKQPIAELPLASQLNICTVARLSNEKGWLRIRYLCKALQELNIDFKWFIIGEGYFEDQIHRIHLILDSIPQVQFLGKMLNPFPVVKQMDYLALLSDYESWGLVITEGKILNVPIIVSDFAAAKEQVENDYNGLIISRTKYSTYRDAAMKIYKNKKIYKNGLKDFDFEKTNLKSVEQWKNIIEN